MEKRIPVFCKFKGELHRWGELPADIPCTNEWISRCIGINPDNVKQIKRQPERWVVTLARRVPTPDHAARATNAIRRALDAAFPDQGLFKGFYVKRDGRSVYVGWRDGPRSSAVMQTIQGCLSPEQAAAIRPDLWRDLCQPGNVYGGVWCLACGTGLSPDQQFFCSDACRAAPQDAYPDGWDEGL
jgi:hypothetical protein